MLLGRHANAGIADVSRATLVESQRLSGVCVPIQVRIEPAGAAPHSVPARSGNKDAMTTVAIQPIHVPRRTKVTAAKKQLQSSDIQSSNRWKREDGAAPPFDRTAALIV